VITLDEAAGQKLFIIFGDGEQAGVFEFDGVKTPVLKQTIVSTNEQLMCALSIHGGLLAFSHPAGTNFSTRYYAYKTGGPAFEFTAFGGLPSLADNDNVTIPEIHSRIVANLAVTNESDMKPYTNTIPGTRVTYAMVPIPSGEFVMGSPDPEPNRKPDEGPLHKVKISPFWMGKCEVTWNEYELFMYPDEEQRMRAAEPTDEAGDKLADAVTHPSKPYVEMSFGMGKEGFPAISMTQHGANKYCHGSAPRPASFIACPLKLNGNTHVALVPPTPISLAMMPPNSASTPGSNKIAISNIKRSARKNLTPGAFMIFTAMSSNGSLISTIPIFTKNAPLKAPSLIPGTKLTSLIHTQCAAVHGTMKPLCAAAPLAGAPIAHGKCRIRNCQKASGTTRMPNGSASASSALSKSLLPNKCKNIGAVASNVINHL
jgi:hypothetical protein